MHKIPTLFRRDPDNMSRVLPEVHPDCQWVIDGEGVATWKYDGTCVMFDGERWWARREVKAGKTPPPNFEPVTTDPNTGKTMGWEPIEQSAFAKFHAEALANEDRETNLAPEDPPTFEPGTYELVGPKINGNPEGTDQHQLWAHSAADQVDAPRDFDGLAKFLSDFAGEGLVWHHPDGRMAKLKRRDFRCSASGVTRRSRTAAAPVGRGVGIGHAGRTTGAGRDR